MVNMPKRIVDRATQNREKAGETVILMPPLTVYLVMVLFMAEELQLASINVSNVTMPLAGGR